ncbi:MAG TPA: phosphatase PAP2 family protein [Chitinophaga sp.]|uniref:phosphatase PAP2 family protein n=1 Tax=Chitinophaga sp. TaxID=1869181 RepID=UPI002BE84644|nr:phosphatase PAP2 family protein [Chitinophaga sp.]HVI43237.1 phosphatase PAP2 family protein [Chitinophaga sp.]
MKQDTFWQRFTTVYRQLKMLIWPFAVVLAGILVFRFLYGREDIYFYINRLHTSWGDTFFPYITELGSTGAAVAITIVLFLVNRRAGFMMATAYTFTSLVNFTLKFLVAFPRPHRYFEHRLQEIYFVPGVTVLDNFRSFPSGHSVCAFTAATLLSYYVKNKYWSWLFLVLASLVAYSRMYMSQHFLEDVTAGATEAILLTMLWLTFIKGKGYAAAMDTGL